MNKQIQRAQKIAPHLACISLLVVSGALLAESSASSTDVVESVPDRSPAELLPAAMIAGPDFHVADPVHGDGLMNHFVLESRFGTFEAYGRAALAIRIHEIAALTELAKTSDVQVVAGGAVKGVETEVKTATTVLTHPVKTVTGIPKGIAHLFVGYRAQGEELAGEAKSVTHASGEGNSVHKTAAQGEKLAKNYAERYLGITAAERDYYRKLGVDPYTDNKPLRDAIHRDAELSAAAGFGVKFASLPAIPAIGITQRAVDAIYNEDPAAIRERMRKTLRGYGLSASEIAAFMNAPLLSPTRQVVLLSAAQALEGVAQRGELFRHALGLTSDEEVQVYLRSLGLLVKAQASRPFAAVVPGVRLPTAVRADHTLVVCGAFEAVYWTKGVAQAEKQLRMALPTEPEGSARELWVAGIISERARGALQDHGWQLHEVADEAGGGGGAATEGPAL